MYFKALITFYLCELNNLFLSTIIFRNVSSKDWSFSTLCITIDFIVSIYGPNPSIRSSWIFNSIKEILWWKELDSK